MNRYLYVLDGHEPRRARSVLDWGKWMARSDCSIARTSIDDVEVSTVFLGVDHEFSPHGALSRGPVLFETAIFKSAQVVIVCRYRTWDEAEKAHAFIVECLQDAMHKRRIDPNQAIAEAHERWLQRGVNEHGNAT